MSTSLKSIRIKNFKAIKDSGTIKLSPLTVFIGNNGSGKSSVIEALRTMQDIVDEGLDQAMHNWHGFEHIWHKGANHEKVSRSTDRPSQSDPMSIEIRGKGKGDFKTFRARSTMSLGESGDELFFVDELLKTSDWEFTRDRTGQTRAEHEDLLDDAEPSDLVKMLPLYVRDYGGSASIAVSESLPDDESLLEGTLEWFISEWQYLAMDPQLMGLQVPQQRTGGRVSLNRDGSNIAEYLLSIRELDPDAFSGIVENLQYVLPYAADLQAAVTMELERSVYLQMTENSYKVLGWLMSSGTLRLLALLALFRHPTPPPLIMIEEIENGIDPRALNLIVEELKRIVNEKKIQVLITTHSPYLLDLLDLSQIVVVERGEGVTFSRPSDTDELENWSKNFSVGELYTMGKLNNLTT